MFLRRFTDFILQSRLQAILVAFVSAFIPVIGSISIVIAALVTLRKGIVEGAIVTLAATLPYIISYAAYPVSSGAEITLAATVVLIASNVLTWLLACCLRKYSAWGLTLEVAGMLGLIAIAIAHGINPNIQDWWVTHLGAYLQKTTAMLGAQPDADTTAAQLEMLNVMKRFATGFVAASVLFNALLQLVVARWWQAVMFNPGGLRRELHDIRLSYVAGVVFVVGLALSYLGSAVALDMMPVMFVTFCAAGLSLLHYLAAPANFGWVILALIYLAIIWLLPVSIVIVALIALLDTAADVRKRFNRI